MTAQLMRYKKSVPFSERLNDWITEKVAQLVSDGHIDGIDFTDSDDYGTLEAIKNYYKDTHRLIVWTGGSDDTIFADPEVNWAFRAWHDYVHIVNDLPFTVEGESLVAFLQAAELPKDWYLERQLILSEVVGQVLYNHFHNGEFPSDQRAFTVHFCLTGDVRRRF